MTEQEKQQRRENIELIVKSVGTALALASFVTGTIEKRNRKRITH